MTFLCSALYVDISLAVKPIRHGQLLRSLLRSVIVVAQEQSPVLTGYESIIAVIDRIGVCCMWWPTLRAIVTALKSLRKEETQILLKHAELRASWLQMVRKVEDRSQLHNSMRYVPYCQNPQCTVVGSKALKRCTACLNMSVCSPECQESEWKNGHKEKCRYLRASPCPTMRAEDEDFLRYLIKQDIPKREQLMMPETLTFLTKGNEQYSDPGGSVLGLPCQSRLHWIVAHHPMSYGRAGTDRQAEFKQGHEYHPPTWASFSS
ncbi:hypothetical protein ARMSODRAFT_527768 [Armillaria solidipes]|uniref:MYND-type domain-containing protein n=1 Tax=Armillaria solidipes TaxID=1076256 RepID=A0A2H3BCR7_9AGAR|nr:hypothetical protein ARMSODRAFT_527768 [Armillaria solidipes]